MNKEEKEQICKSLIEDNLTSIVFSRNITKIRNCCFYDCKSLQSISFEEPCQITKIPNHCFRYCTKLSSVTIPSSITNIEYSSFEGCQSLQSITIPNSVTRLGMYCFFQCPKLTSVTFEEPCQITELPYSCFSNQYFSTPNLLTSINIPSSVKILGQNCFYNCGLTSITIPNSVTSIENKCFQSCSALETVTFEEPCQISGLPSSCFNECKSLTSITVPNSVTSLGNSCFYNCNELQSINIPNTIKSIGSGCFTQCSKLSEITFEEPCQITTLPWQCFYSCSSLKSFTIPSSVKTLEYGCFYQCYGLTEITIPNSVTSVGDECFGKCSELTTITIPSSVTSMGDNCFTQCNKLTTIYIDKPTDSIAGAPWGATNATVIWNDTIIKNYIVGTTEMLAGSSSYLPVSYVYPENGWKKGVTYTIKLLSLPTNSGSISKQTLSICQIDNSSSMTYTNFVSNVALSSYIGQSWTWTPDKDYYGMPTGILVSEYPAAGVCVGTQQANNHIIAEIEISW